MHCLFLRESEYILVIGWVAGYSFSFEMSYISKCAGESCHGYLGMEIENRKSKMEDVAGWPKFPPHLADFSMSTSLIRELMERPKNSKLRLENAYTEWEPKKVFAVRSGSTSVQVHMPSPSCNSTTCRPPLETCNISAESWYPVKYRAIC